MAGLKLTAEEFEARKEEFSPDHHDFYWSEDFSTVEVVRLKWLDNPSYQHHQGDGMSDEEYEAAIAECRALSYWIPEVGSAEWKELMDEGRQQRVGDGEQDIPY